MNIALKIIPQIICSKSALNFRIGSAKGLMTSMVVEKRSQLPEGSGSKSRKKGQKKKGRALDKNRTTTEEFYFYAKHKQQLEAIKRKLKEKFISKKKDNESQVTQNIEKATMKQKRKESINELHKGIKKNNEDKTDKSQTAKPKDPKK